MHLYASKLLERASHNKDHINYIRAVDIGLLLCYLLVCSSLIVVECVSGL